MADITPQEIERAIIVGLNLNNNINFLHSMEELKALTKACNIEVIGMHTQNASGVNNAFYVGTGKVDEIKESMVYGKKPEANSRREEKELIITARVIPDYDKIKELHGDLSEKEIYDIIWKNIKEVNKKLTSYKAVKALEIKEGEFEKTSTMKIKRYKELNNNK